MRRYICLSIMLCVVFASQVLAIDLRTIERTLRKEPAYQSKNPLYCLLVFGPAAKTRVWVVLDGDVLYVDRNGNGDLTDPGERIAAQEVRHNQDPDEEVRRHFERNCWKAGEEPVLTCGPGVQWFYILQIVPRADGHDRTWVKDWQEKPFAFAITTKTGGAQRARLRFATSPQEAPILHFDGPRRFVLSEKVGPQRFRPGESLNLFVELHTQGLNGALRMRTESYAAPENVHPVAEIEFPPGRPGADPIRVHVELKGRC